jgi:hypothetical protein
MPFWKSFRLLFRGKRKMERVKGIEPSGKSAQAPDIQDGCCKANPEVSQMGAHLADKDRHNLARIVAAWPNLPEAIRAAIRALIASTTRPLDGRQTLERPQDSNARTPPRNPPVIFLPPVSSESSRS